MIIKKSFASDNNSGIHSDVLQAIHDANKGHVTAYGDDPYTKQAIQKFKEHFGKDIDVYLMFSGTATNVLSFRAVTDPIHAIICPTTAHIHTSECGAAEKFTGCKLLPIPTENGKINPNQIKNHFPHLGEHGDRDQHHNQPKIISITQSTEVGTVYTPDELRALADFAHQYEMLLHMDGARISNAAASLDVGFREITTDVGVDLLSFGGTKNGLMFAEAVIFFNPTWAKYFKHIRKQGMQLSSKMRFIAVQFNAFLSNELWYRNAKHANAMAKKLASELEKIPSVQITQPVQSNAVFAIIPPEYVPILQKKYFFYVWNEETSEVRLMCSFDTTEEEIENFVNLIKSKLT